MVFAFRAVSIGVATVVISNFSRQGFAEGERGFRTCPTGIFPFGLAG